MEVRRQSLRTGTGGSPTNEVRVGDFVRTSAALRRNRHSLADTKILEHDIENFFDIDRAGEAAEKTQGKTEVFGE